MLFTGSYFRRTISELLNNLNGSNVLRSGEDLLEKKLFKFQKFEGPVRLRRGGSTGNPVMRNGVMLARGCCCTNRVVATFYEIFRAV